MRLVDSDKVVRITREEVKDEDNTLPVQFRAGVDYVLKIIDELSTVDVITIEWINNWAETGGNEQIDDFTDVDTYCDGYQKNVIECLLRAWEKENETN